MKVLTLFCALIIGMVLGAGLAHKAQLGSALHALTSPGSKGSAAPSSPDDARIYASSSTSATQDSATITERTIIQSSPEDAKKLANLERNLAQLSKNYQFLNTQLLEANREIQSLRFIVDTHSESFRPLRSEQNKQNSNTFSPPAGLSPLLPPRD